MPRLTTLLVPAIAALAAACANEVPPNAEGPGGAGAGLGASGAGGLAGGPGDPTSIAYFQQSIGDTVYFATDSSELDQSSQAVLRAQAGWLRSNPVRNATIEGHADERGTREYNLGLGARRAAAVRNFLVAEGVDSSRLRSVTYGKERPVSLCSNESCWSRNRRAVTVAMDAPTG